MTMAATAVLSVFLLIGMPVGWAVAVGVAVVLLMNPTLPLTLVPQLMFQATDEFALLAIPLFLLAGNIMGMGGLSTRIVDFALSVVGAIRGGLSLVAVLAAMLFAGVSGSAIADSAAIGALLIPQMIRRGYDPAFAASLVASAGAIGPIIPPSIAFILFATVVNASIKDLFLAGLIPGVIVGISLMVYAYFYSVRHGYPTEGRVSLLEVWRRFLRTSWALLTPLIVVGGIVTGVFTPTESAGVAVFVALLTTGVIYRDLKLSQIPEILRRSADQTAIVMLLIMSTKLLSWVFTLERIPFALARTMSGLTADPFLMLLMVNVVLLVAGTVLDAGPAILLFGPLFLPLMNQLGIDTVHYGVVLVVNLMIAGITPPTVPLLAVTSAISGVPLGRLCVRVLPFLGVEMVALGIITYFPQLYMWLPAMFR